MSKSRDIADSAATINYIDTVTSNVQTQLNTLDTALDNISVTSGTLTKTFTSGESASISLTSSVLAPVVSVTKEVPQSGVTNNNWDVNSTTENYTRLDSAAATTLSWGVDLANASYVSGFNIGSQETVAQGLAFSSDGTKMYIVGLGVDTVFQYSLSTAFDVSTASYNSVSFSVASQETTPLGLDFSADGTKMYVVGYTNSIVYQYSLSTAWDLSTASYSSISFDLNSQETQAIFVSIVSNGTKMYIRGFDNGDVFYQYTLSTAYDVSTASYDSISFNPSANATQPKSLSFSTNGTLLYIMGGGADAVYQYSLSTAFNISTATYDSISFSVASQDNQPADLAVIGSKLYFIGGQNTSVYQYSLPAGNLQLGTGSFASADVGKTIEANSGVFVLTAADGSFVETTAPTSYAQVASGDWSMYGVVYNAADGDLELSSYASAYSLPNASYDSISLGLTDGIPTAFVFSTDGTKLFVIGYVLDAVLEYNVSSAFDLSTAVYSQSFSVLSQTTTTQGLSFKPDGTKMYIASYSDATVYEYTLSTAFNVSTASFSQSFSTASNAVQLTGIVFSATGDKFFVVSSVGSIYEYTLSTAFDISTAAFVDSLSLTAQATLVSGCVFNSDGTKLFICATDVASIFEYTLSTAFDISTASYTTSVSISAVTNTLQALDFSADGTKMYILSSSGDAIYQYSVSSSYITTGYQPVHTTASIDSTYWTDINSMTADQAAGDGNVYYAISTDDRTTWTVIDETDGERDIVRNNAGTWQYNSNATYASETWVNGATNTELATLAEAMEGAAAGYNLSIANYNGVNLDISAQIANNWGQWVFGDNGNKLYIKQDTGNLYQYSLSSAYDISTASFDKSHSLGNESFTTGIAFNNDGTKLYNLGRSNTPNVVYEHNLSTPWDIASETYNSVSLSLTSAGTVSFGILFNPDGTIMYISDFVSNSIYQYSLSSAFDLSTASYASKSLSAAAQSTNIRGMAFNGDGTKFFVTSSANGGIYQYGLTVAYDISSASYDSVSYDASVLYAGNTNAVLFNANGSKMFVAKNQFLFELDVATFINQMDKTQLDAVTDPNHIALGDALDLAIVFNMTSGSTVPSSDGVAINYDANVLNKGAVLGTDYDFDAPAQNSVRITALAGNNLKVRVV